MKTQQGGGGGCSPAARPMFSLSPASCLTPSLSPALPPAVGPKSEAVEEVLVSKIW